MQKRFIETTRFPIDLVNDKSGGEKQGGGRPPFWEMVFWWTRKPLIGARSVIAGSLLPEDVNADIFKKIVRLSEKTPHRYNPDIPDDLKIYFDGKRMLDPFSGFGSIPFEGLRLGLDVTANDLLPTAHVFLKAVLEYPLKYGNKLVKDVGRWGDWVTDRLKEDEDIKELYDDDVAVYIGTWEVRCPHCGRWTPLIGNWWLARVKDSKGRYKRLAYMDYEKIGDGVGIKVVDVNREVADKVEGKLADTIANAKVDTTKGEIIIDEGKGLRYHESEISEPQIKDLRYKVPSSNIESRREQATCLNCGGLIRLVDADGNHYTDRKSVAKKKELEWYVKWALKRYNEGDERFARQRLLVRVKTGDGDLVFEPCDEKDNEKLERAKEKVKDLERVGDVDIPDEQIPLYDPRSIWVINYGFTKWKHLFNPRQLLTLVKLVKLIREAGKRVETEKIKDGWTEEDARDYAEGITTYLSVALVNHVRHNCIVNSVEPTIKILSHAFAFRGITMTWNWIDEYPVIDFIGSWVRSIRFIIKSLEYLISSFNNSNQQKLTKDLVTNPIKVILDDATSLSKINGKFDVIVTDPPYADDVPYTELSDFYYVWLKRALSDVEDGRLIPKFHPDAFFKKIGDKNIEIKTQWQDFAKREVSTNAGRFIDEEESKTKAEEHFQNLLTQSFIAMREHLKDDGLMVTYYAHTSPEAWASLLDAGWKGAKATITNAFPLTTESAQSVVSRGKLALDTSIIVVWRLVEQKDEKNILSLRDEIIDAAKTRARELIEQGYIGRDVLIGAMAAALNIVTRYKGLYDGKGDLSIVRLLTDYIYPFTSTGIAESLREKSEIGEIKSPDGLFYLLVKALFGSKEKMAVKKMDKSDIILLKISTGVDTDRLVTDGLIKKTKEEYTLHEPMKDDTSFLERFLRDDRGINLAKQEIRNSLDVLHLMEYYSMILPISKLKSKWDEIKGEYSSEGDEAFTLANILYQILPDVDAEKKLVGEFVGKIKGERLEV